jgi:hypothetical protein
MQRSQVQSFHASSSSQNVCCFRLFLFGIIAAGSALGRIVGSNGVVAQGCRLPHCLANLAADVAPDR